VIAATEQLTGRSIERAFVDKRYRGHNTEHPRRVCPAAPTVPVVTSMVSVLIAPNGARAAGDRAGAHESPFAEEDLAADVRNVLAGSRTKKPSLRARIERFLDPALHPGIRDAVKQALNGIVQLSTQLRDEFRNLKAQP
jgi:hypothetical protein